jgi:hypothetical protein
VDDYVDISDDDSLDITKQITIEFWAKRPSSISSIPISKWASGGRTFQISWNNTGEIVADFSQDASASAGNRRIFTTTNGFTSLNTWYHFVIVADVPMDDYKVYVNGKDEAGTKSWDVISSLYVSTAPLRIGNRDVSGNESYFDGFIDEVRIYNRALSAEEIRYHYNRGGPVAHWKFDEGSGTTTYDGTNNNNDGTLGDGTCSPGDHPSSCPAWTTGKFGSARMIMWR